MFTSSPIMLFRPVLTQNRCLYRQAFKSKHAKKMAAWTIHSYGDLEELQLTQCRVPIIGAPDDVLVQVEAASLNPIDSLMLGGYGQKTFQFFRNFQLEFPLILGRDFSGRVIAKGHNAIDFKIGEEVYGFVPLHKQGSFAETVLTSKDYILPKPSRLSHSQSASLVYATMTAWGALFITGNLACRQRKDLKILVLGGSGGVGTTAIQLLKSQGCLVYSSCSTDAVDLVASIGADKVFDRNNPNFEQNVKSGGKYHVILDAAKVGINNIPRTWQYETYISLNSPLMINNDKYGLVGGFAKSLGDLVEMNAPRLCQGKSVRWGYFVPSKSGFAFIDQLIKTDKIRPVIQQEFKFADLPQAIQTLRQGHARGKIVISHE